MKFRQFFEENLEKYPEMMLNDLEDRWKKQLEANDIFTDPKKWADAHPEVPAAMVDGGLGHICRVIQRIYFEETNIRLPLRDTLALARKMW